MLELVIDFDGISNKFRGVVSLITSILVEEVVTDGSNVDVMLVEVFWGLVVVAVCLLVACVVDVYWLLKVVDDWLIVVKLVLLENVEVEVKLVLADVVESEVEVVGIAEVCFAVVFFVDVVDVFVVVINSIVVEVVEEILVLLVKEVLILEQVVEPDSEIEIVCLVLDDDALPNLERVVLIALVVLGSKCKQFEQL